MAQTERKWYHVSPWLIGAGAAVLGLALWRRKDVTEGAAVIQRGAQVVLDFIKKEVFRENYGGLRGQKPGLIVLHTSEGTVDSALSWFGMDHKPSGQGPTSAHYLISKAGTLYSLVPDDYIAYHAGNWDYNVRGIGIELEGKAEDPNNFTVEALAALVLLVRNLSQKYGIPLDRQHIIGHNEVPKQSHTDPGKYFPWDKFMSTLTGGAVA